MDKAGPHYRTRTHVLFPSLRQQYVTYLLPYKIYFRHAKFLCRSSQAILCISDVYCLTQNAVERRFTGASVRTTLVDRPALLLQALP